MGQSRPFNTVDRKIQYKFLPMTGFEPWTSGVGSNRSTNWATTIALESPFNRKLFLPTIGSNPWLMLFISLLILSGGYTYRWSSLYFTSIVELGVRNSPDKKLRIHLDIMQYQYDTFVPRGLNLAILYCGKWL